MKKKVNCLVMVIIIMMNMFATICFADNNSRLSEVEPYQGIFMKENIFISIPLYSSVEPNEPIGVAYQVSRPAEDSHNHVNYEIIDTLGDVYQENSDKYYIEGSSFRANLCYRNGGIVLYNILGASEYEGEYIQVSNAGANMSPSQIWLNIPDVVSTPKPTKEPTSNSDNTGTITVDCVDLSIKVNGKKVNFTDAYPFIDDAGRTQVPVRFIAEELGYDVQWHEKSMDYRNGAVSIGSDILTTKYNGKTAYMTLWLFIGSTDLTISYEDGPTTSNRHYLGREDIYMDTTATIKNGRTYIPLRYIAEALGYTVEWK